MRRRPPPEEIQLLSTSFLDLLCCGLCSVVLLWVLTGTGGKASPDEPFGFIQVGQNGIWHWEAIEVSADGGKSWPYHVTNMRSRSRNSRDDTAVLKDKLGLTVTVRNGGDQSDEFAGLLSLSADRQTANISIRVVFETCGIKDGVHVIRVTGQSGTRLIEDAFVYTLPDALDEAIQKDAGLREWYMKSVRCNICDILGTKGRSETALRFEVIGGLISYKAPDTIN